MRVADQECDLRKDIVLNIIVNSTLTTIIYISLANEFIRLIDFLTL